jgi:hypothetical protein
VLGVLVAVGALPVAVIAPFVAIGTVVGLVFMLRVGVYKAERGRGELVAHPRSQAPAAAVVHRASAPGANLVAPANGDGGSEVLDGVVRDAAENGEKRPRRRVSASEARFGAEGA